MKISTSNLYIWYPHVGSRGKVETSIMGVLNANGHKFENLMGEQFKKIARYIKELPNNDYSKTAVGKVEEYKQKGVEGIYQDPNQPPITVFDYKSKYFVNDGNHRVLALILLDEKEIETKVYHLEDEDYVSRFRS